jgi:hypothetical protein
MVAIGLAFASAGCGPSVDDIHHWETTVQGPDRLRKLLMDERQSTALRAEAALSLVRMKPRMGRSIGLEVLALGRFTADGLVPDALGAMSPTSCRLVADALAPELATQLASPRPAPSAHGEPVPPDPRVPYEDAAFALLTHTPPLPLDYAASSKLREAMVGWVPTAFEWSPDQTFTIERVVRYLGPDGARSLVPLITSETKGTSANTVSSVCHLIGELGDEATKNAAGEALVGVARVIDSPAWLDQSRAMIEAADASQHVTVTQDQVANQLKAYQRQGFERVLSNMRVVGGPAVVAYASSLAADATKSAGLRMAALGLAGKDTPDRRVVVRPVSITGQPGAVTPQLPVALQSALHAAQVGFNLCYQQGLNQNPELHGMLQARLTLNVREGRVDAVRRDDASTLIDDGVLACVLGVLRGLTLAASGRGTATATVPIEFSATLARDLTLDAR